MTLPGTLRPEWLPRTAGCTHPMCGDLDCATVDGVHGRRCHQHPPHYSPRYLMALMTARRYPTARAYVRAMVAWGQETDR